MALGDREAPRALAQEPVAARAALEASAARVVQKDAAAREKIATDAAAKKNQTAAGGGLSPAPPKEAPAPAPASPASPRRRYAAARFAWYVARRGASSKSRPYDTGASMARPYNSIAEQ